MKIESLIESIESQLNIIVSDILSKSVEGFYSKQFNTKDLKAYEYNKNRKDKDWYSPNTDKNFGYLFKELDLKENHCLYWFELETLEKTKALNNLINNYRLKKGQEDYRVVPSSNKNVNSKVLYVGIRRGAKSKSGLTNIVGRINQHLGYYKVQSTQGLQLIHYAQGLDFQITLNVVEFEDLENPMYLNLLEKMVADKLIPLCGRH